MYPTRLRAVPASIAKRIIYGSLLVILGLFVASQVVFASSPYDPIRQATRRVYTQNGSNGSGVMIAPKLMLTAAHVAIIPDLFVNGNPVTKVIKRDDARDIALLLVRTEDCPCVDLGEFPEVDDQVYAVGFPLDQLIKVQILTEGRLQAYIENEARFVVTTPIASGNSGGGLFVKQNDKLVLIGIIVEQPVYGPNPMIQHPVFYISRAVDIKTIREFLN